MVENLGKKVDSFLDSIMKLDDSKKDLIEEEKSVLENTIKKMDDFQKEFLSLLQNRKIQLVEQINRFYSSKIKYK